MLCQSATLEAEWWVQGRGSSWRGDGMTEWTEVYVGGDLIAVFRWRDQAEAWANDPRNYRGRAEFVQVCEQRFDVPMCKRLAANTNLPPIATQPA